MPTCSINNTFILFADDTHIIISDCSANKLKVKLELTINDIMLWVKLNKLTINSLIKLLIKLTACPLEMIYNLK